MQQAAEVDSTVDISDELQKRPVSSPDYLREKIALQDLARQMSEHPELMLPRLVELAKLSCGADSAGISLFESDGDIFRWHYLSGILATFSGATTPRRFSPCGVCLDRRSPVLMKNPEMVYDWIAEAHITVPEVLLVPLYVGSKDPFGTLWIVASDGQHFDSGHARVISEYASFAGLALKMIGTENKLKHALDEQQLLTKEMSHRVKNVFAVADGMIRLTARNSNTPRQMAQSLSARMYALATAHSLVRRNLDDLQIGTTELSALLRAILAPHALGTNLTILGPPVSAAEHATNGLALMFHELATNSAKYGAFSQGGSVKVTWEVHEEMLALRWEEAGGPIIAGAPTSKGFGTALVERTAMSQFGGSINYDWQPAGVQISLSLASEKLRR